MGLTTQDSYTQKEHTELYKILKLWRYIYDKIQFTEMAIQLVESDIQQVKFDKKKATKGEKH